MLNNQIIQVLSYHRAPGRPHLPQTLTRFQIMGLLKHSEPPSFSESSLTPANIDTELHNLEAQGEVLLGIGKRACMARPTVVVESPENLVGLKFTGDRAYLRLAHQMLNTGQPVSRTLLRPQKQSFPWIQEHLLKAGINCLTIEQSISQLPLPEIPAAWSLRGQERLENPFFTYQGFDSIFGYQPIGGAQRDRWKVIVGLEHLASISSLNLLRTPEGEFLWLQDGQFFELAPDAAYLAMFKLDQQVEQPLQIALDAKPGRLSLRDTYLPKAYAQMIWRLSKADPDHNRIRLVEPQNQPRVKTALERLGCVLV